MSQDDGIGVVASATFAVRLPTDVIRPPAGGRAPGWDAGLVVARRERLVVGSVGGPVAKVAEVSPA
jgi:hypothetical protein